MILVDRRLVRASFRRDARVERVRGEDCKKTRGAGLFGTHLRARAARRSGTICAPPTIAHVAIGVTASGGHRCAAVTRRTRAPQPPPRGMGRFVVFFLPRGAQGPEIDGPSPPSIAPVLPHRAPKLDARCTNTSERRSCARWERNPGSAHASPRAGAQFSPRVAPATPRRRDPANARAARTSTGTANTRAAWRGRERADR